VRPGQIPTRAPRLRDDTFLPRLTPHASRLVPSYVPSYAPSFAHPSIPLPIHNVPSTSIAPTTNGAPLTRS